MDKDTLIKILEDLPINEVKRIEIYYIDGSDDKESKYLNYQA